MINQNATLVHIPAHGTPYSGIRKNGDHKRAYTVATLAACGFIQWNAKAGKVTGFAAGNVSLLSSMLGNSAFNHWTRTTGRVDKESRKLTVNGQNEVTGSLIGKGNLNTIPGLITAYIAAFASGILKEPGTGNLIERFNANVETKATTATTATTATKATKATTATATKAKATTKATKATTKATKAKPVPVLITPESKK